MESEPGSHFEDLRKRLSALQDERLEILSELHAMERAGSQRQMEAVLDEVPVNPEDKVLLFKRRFAARPDIFPRFWENVSKGTKGYYPVCETVYEAGVRLRPSEFYSRFGSSKFSRLDEKVIEDHLRGKHTIGSYSIRKDDTCIFLAADFDGEGWEACAVAYSDSAEIFGFRTLIEISRSGNGAHVWLFFAEPIPARLARSLGTVILGEVSSRLSKVDLGAYDRFFPNQDTMPRGGFGNLIGLPLQWSRRKSGCTVFVDTNLFVFEDQWATLAKTPCYWEHHIRTALERFVEISPIEECSPEDIAVVSLTGGKLGGAAVKIPDWRVELRESLLIPEEGLPDEFIAKIIRLATFPNPEFFEKQRMRFPVFGIPRYIVSAGRQSGWITIPRGCMEAVTELFATRGSRLEVEDFRLSEKRIRIRFAGTLTRVQKSAVAAIEANEYGVLVAPPGSGKTVMACALIARWKLATVILINRRSLADQWRERLGEFTTISEERCGIWGGGKRKLSGIVDVVMIQSLARTEDVASFFRNYSLVVIDECHHMPAVSFEGVLKLCACRRILGLTATPSRKDGLENLLFQQCGPVRFRISEYSDPSLEKRIQFVETGFGSGLGTHLALHEIWEELIQDVRRNELLVSFVRRQLRDGRKCLIISDRVSHLESMGTLLRECTRRMGIVPELMTGGRGTKALKEQNERIRMSLSDGKGICLLATGSFLGEGYNLPELDTLFLSMPISFKGRLIQYAGRLHRKCEGKGEVRVFDFIDEKLPIALSMFRKRKPAYKEMGYVEVRECSGAY
ncbi:DEAD/DEAH box helicase family protein [Pelagicoccus sp. SDUM812005]|uniref:TOTE conflict system archaeo-eukaryotic primase domain-containing protein n=1 Tax=Pelagicoccus sp. SDUM812005 TaxID=3041257 RepID=UPI00280FFC79|nr:DEAD/DEAH box helicase family protein [Pelagicoccus sp. SDUM812005]MDQ8181959.1 DEAD/DEAH box helicase family protein [Pelagicoccus sp. SDUM812005]